MIETIETKELHCCDICKRRIPSTSITNCVVCNKEICQYCRIKLTRTFRKRPDSGYSVYQQSAGNLCVTCANKKLNLGLDEIRY